MNREMLKEAIAEAKTIKETAIANAKAALEEAFTPQLTAMFANKLNEMEDEEMMEEKSMDEMYGDDNLEEDFNLEEILAELEATEEGYSMEEEDMLNEGDEDLMLEEMSDEEIEELVIKVINDMVSSGKLMAGEEDVEDEEEDEDEMMDDEDLDIEMEDEEDEDINIEELLSEMEDKEDLDEIVDPATGEFIAKAAEFLGTNRDAISAIVAALPAGVAGAAFLRQLLKGRKPSKSNKTEAQLDELKNELNEVNLLNAKLLYTNKVFRSKNLTESEKIKVLNHFDKAENVKEVKLVYETIIESLKSSTKKSPIRESFSSASKTISGPSTKQPVIEVNEAFARMQKIAGLK